MKTRLSALLLIFVFMLESSESLAQSLQNLFNRGNIKKGAKNLKSLKRESEDPADYILRPQYRIFTNEPYWLMKKSSYENFYYNLVTHSILGSYDVSLLSGKPRNVNEIKWVGGMHENEETGDSSNIFQYTLMKNPGAEVYLLVSCYGDVGKGFSPQTAYAGFLANDRSVQDTMIFYLKRLKRDITVQFKIPQGKFGIILDFQNIPNDFGGDEQMQQFRKMIENIKSKLLPKGENAALGIKLPSLQESNNFYYNNPAALKKIISTADFVIYKNYSLDLTNISPDQLDAHMSANYRIIHQNLDSLNKLGIATSKIFMEFAFLGLNLKKDSTVNQLFLDPIAPLITYDQMNRAESFTGKSANQLDSSMTIYRFLNGNEYHYDNEHIRLYKYESLKKAGVPGISLYGIGYNNIDNGTKYWKALADVFGRVPDKLIWYFMGVLLGVLSLGFPYSVVKYWQVRNVLARFKKYLLPALGGWFIAVFGFLFCLNIIPRNTVGVIIGTGILMLLLLFILFQRYTSRLFKLFRK